MPQPHKGDRHAQTIRVPMPHHELYVAEAERAGLPYGDYLVRKLAEAHQLDMPTPGPTSSAPALIDEVELRANATREAPTAA